MSVAAVDPSAVTWRDPKRYLWPLGLLVPLLPFMAFGLAEATGLGIFWWWGPFFFYVLLPLLDWVVGKDAANPPDEVIKSLEEDRYYRWCTYAYIPLQFAALIGACFFWAGNDLAVIEKVGLAFTVGIVSGVAINTAHELGHKRKSLEKWLSKVALASTFYGHFFIEHNRGHHVRVATPEDPASSKLGESFWRFLPRTVWGSLTSAWELEAKRLERTGDRTFSLKNDILNAWLMSIVLFAGLVIGFGPEILPYLLIQTVFGFQLLEVVNYLEHYGLCRQKREDGRYERCAPRHSWNSNNIGSNVLLYHLQRHSDHHANPVRRYQALRHFDEAPELPSGYGTMIPLAYFPPVWRRIMDPKVSAHYEGDLTLANVHPAKRKKYGLPA